MSDKFIIYTVYDRNGKQIVCDQTQNMREFKPEIRDHSDLLDEGGVRPPYFYRPINSVDYIPDNQPLISSR